MNETTPAPDASAAPTGMLGIGTPPIARDLARYLAAETALLKLTERIGEPLDLVYREEQIPSRRWWLGFPDGSPVALCADPLEAVQAGEELL